MRSLSASSSFQDVSGSPSQRVQLNVQPLHVHFSPKVNPHVNLFYVQEGSVEYRLDHIRFRIPEGNYLLCNPVQQVKPILQDGAKGWHIQIPLAAFKTVFRRMQFDSSGKKFNDFTDLSGNLAFYEGVYPAESVFEQLTRLWEEKPHTESQSVLALAEYVIRKQTNVFNQLNRLNSTKLSTKKELYRRLCLARDYIHSNLHTALDLDTLSQVACLSKYHFIRLFKEAFEVTPRQYLIARRLEKASSLLLNSSKSFHEICLEVGLKDSSSFGRLFKKNYGATPHIYRRMYANAG